MTFPLSKHLFRRSGTVDTSFKAIVAAAAVFLSALLPAPAVTNTLDHVPYTTGMWSVSDWFGFGSLSNALTRLTAVEATTNAVAETDPVALPLISVLSTGKVDVASFLSASNALGSSVSVLQTGKVSQAQWVAGSNSFATAAQGALADTALQVEVDPVALAVLSTQRVTRVWASDGLTFAETGVVWQVGSATNYTVALSADLRYYAEGVYDIPASFTIREWPYNDVVDGSGTVTQGGGFVLQTATYGLWTNAYTDIYPVTLFGETIESCGTAVVSQHVSTVYYPAKSYAYQSDLTAVSNQTVAVQTNLANHASTNAASVIAQAQPSTLTRYGDFGTTNDAGYAAFGTANPAEKYIASLAPTNGQSLAKARYNSASSMGGVLSMSAYVRSGPFNPSTSNAAAYAVLTVYSAAGAVIASNIGARVSIDRGGVSNISTSVTLASAVTNGYVTAEIISGTNAVSYVSPYAGGSYPMSLFSLSTPLSYMTRSEADALYAMRDNGTQVNPTIAGALTINGSTYTNIPEGGAAGAITNGQSGPLSLGLVGGGVNMDPSFPYALAAGEVAANNLYVRSYIGLGSGGASLTPSGFYGANAPFAFTYADNGTKTAVEWGSGSNLADVRMPNGNLTVTGTIMSAGSRVLTVADGAITNGQDGFTLSTNNLSYVPPIASGTYGGMTISESRANTGVKVGIYDSGAWTISGMWPANVTPSAANFLVSTDGDNTYFNAKSGAGNYFQINNETLFAVLPAYIQCFKPLRCWDYGTGAYVNMIVSNGVWVTQ